ncbi:class I SAM-dependent RNA methyltransferase, partial [Streptomyces sp. SID10244]|nr:class I SAM-dependent RNA methyltransferase [Streptomyces sp. SID10244]
AAAMLDARIDALDALGAVHVVESDPAALAAAEQTFADDHRVVLHRGEVAGVAAGLPAPDVVVLDPPRTGAGAAV